MQTEYPNLNSLVIRECGPANPGLALWPVQCDRHRPGHGGRYWLVNLERYFSETDAGCPFLDASVCVIASFLETELPLTSKGIFLRVEGLRGGQRGSPSGRESAPDALTGDQIGLNAPFQANLENSPMRGLSCVGPRIKGKPQSLA